MVHIGIKLHISDRLSKVSHHYAILSHGNEKWKEISNTYVLVEIMICNNNLQPLGTPGAECSDAKGRR